MTSQDITGRVFGDFTVIRRLPDESRTPVWLCRCNVCHAEKTAQGYAIRHGTASGLCYVHRAAWLTEREYEVAMLVGQGLTNREIAARLSISYHTVRSHLLGIYIKCKISRRSALASLAATGQLKQR